MTKSIIKWLISNSKIYRKQTQTESRHGLCQALLEATSYVSKTLRNVIPFSCPGSKTSYGLMRLMVVKATLGISHTLIHVSPQY